MPALLRSVRVEGAGSSAPLVVIEADGPLPLPQVGVVDGPPRIYLDFAGVTPATRGSRQQGHALVRRVRVALYQPEPAITRAVQVAAHERRPPVSCANAIA